MTHFREDQEITASQKTAMPNHVQEVFAMIFRGVTPVNMTRTLQIQEDMVA